MRPLPLPAHALGHVLLIMRQPERARRIADQLTSTTGCQVTLAPSLRVAALLIRGQHYSAMLCDQAYADDLAADALGDDAPPVVLVSETAGGQLQLSPWPAAATEARTLFATLLSVFDRHQHAA
ncbi:MAG: hypothetical protein KC620_05885 [Myxococcales bacterium]|nr:hypothetical protein [Myxococcales bacterium]